MNWSEAIEIEISRRGHQRWRVLCDESHPDHEIHRKRIVEMATGEISSSPSTPMVARVVATPPNPCGGCGSPPPSIANVQPSLAQQAATAAQAATRWAANGFRVASDETQASRRSACNSCEHRDAARDRCNICKCFLVLKLKLPKERCPISRWTEE